MKSRIKRRKFGRTNLYVSELSFGAMNLRRLDTVDEAYEILNYVLDQGINFIDTARSYNGVNGQGQMVESEVLVGNTIRNRTDLDEPIVIVTKGHAYTIPELEEELGTSLEKLGVKGRKNLKIGSNDIKLVYLFHGINKERWATMLDSGAIEKAQQLKAEGVVNFIGFSSHYGDRIEIKAAADTGVFDVAELTYNVFNRSLGEDSELDLLEYLYKKDMGIINMKAFNGNGMPPIYNVLKDYISIDYEAMLNFCLSNKYITTVDAGARYVEEFESDIRTALGKRLDSEQIALLKKEADKVAGDMKNLCRECMHCLEKFECPNGLDFPGLLAVYSRYLINKKLDRDTKQFIKEYKQFELNGEDCAACELCNPWCEYKLDIPEMLKKAHDELGA